MRRSLAALVVLFALVAAACSSGDGGDDETTGTTTRRASTSAEFDQFVNDAITVCYDAKQVRFNRAPNVPRYADDLISSAEEGVRSMQALTLPADQASEIQQHLVDPYIKGNQAWVDAAPALREAATQSWDALQAAIGPALIVYLQSWTRADGDWLRENGLVDCMPEYEMFLRPS